MSNEPTGELTDYAYDQEREMIDDHREDWEAGRVYFIYDETAERWRKVVKP